MGSCPNKYAEEVYSQYREAKLPAITLSPWGFRKCLILNQTNVSSSEELLILQTYMSKCSYGSRLSFESSAGRINLFFCV